MHTIKSLNLNLDEARRGRTWEILPKEYRDTRLAREYPLPTGIEELEKLAAIPIERQACHNGAIYLRRAREQFEAKLHRKSSAYTKIQSAENKATDYAKRFHEHIKAAKSEIRGAVNEVKEVAAQAAASLNDLHAMAREGLDGMMKAHLAGTEWKGEKINAQAFRQCYRLISQDVKALGLPSGEREKAREVLIEEYLKATKATREAVEMKLDTEEEGEPN